MCKSSVDRPARPAVVMIVSGVLKGYVKHPKLFVIASALGIGRLKKRANMALPSEFIRTSGIIAAMYLRLKKRIGGEQAFEIIRAAMLCSGLAVQQASFRSVEAGRTFENLIEYQQRTNQEGSTKLNEMEVIEQTAQRYEFKVTRCVFYEFFSALGVPELTKIICGIDNAIFNTYMPEEVIFHRNGIGNRIADGAQACTFVIENKAAE